MTITALVENTTSRDLKAVHGLSLYVETADHRLLFDLGPDRTLLKNAECLGVDLEQVDTVVISHGHSDHGGALAAFLEVNHTARVYVQRRAFEPHYSKALGPLKVSIGLDPKLAEHPQVVLVDGEHRIDQELLLFTVEDTSRYPSPANRTLYGPEGPDRFGHEQNLMIFGEKNVLIMGCGHCGVVNILERAAMYRPALCVGGYHLWSPSTRRSAPEELLEGIAGEMGRYDMDFYTCHCTGQPAFRYLSGRLERMHYLSCGESISL